MRHRTTMARRIYFITHPDVVIDPALPVPRWPLSDRGRARMRRLLEEPWVADLGALYCSTEQKAIDAASIVAAYTGLVCEQVADLGENDRSSTGFLPKEEFEATADQFFARPEQSVRGWERAVDAQRRIVATVAQLTTRAPAGAPLAVVAHGGVGALLLCHVVGEPISRRRDQPGSAGGNYFVFELPPPRLLQGWAPIDSG
jgi:broad specificity phosphatase PhoE